MLMADFEKLAEQMKRDWDRRIRHDYRFWMSDGYSDDQTMWRSGERDLSLLVADVVSPDQKVLLEIGCGVGRLLNAAASRFKTVIGIDVSQEAIEKARQLLADHRNIELAAGNGYDLHGIADCSIDLVISFAAITSMPTDVAAHYFSEMYRVLTPAGQVRMQFYLGHEQEIGINDTLHLRCFRKENFVKAVSASGFEVEFIKELVLPFEVSYKEGGVEAVLVGLKKVGGAGVADSKVISSILLPRGEEDLTDNGDLECWLSIGYAKELAAEGDYDRAKQALEYAAAQASSVSLDVRDALHKLTQELNKRGQATTCCDVSNQSASQHYCKNVEIVKSRFPKVFGLLLQALPDKTPSGCIEVKETGDGAVIWCQGQCLDHPTKPKQAAEVWVKRLLNETKYIDSEEIVVCGAGAGYHVEELINAGTKRIAVVEPSIEAFDAALKARDLSVLLGQVENLCVGDGELPKFFTEKSELVLRPQTQVLYGEYCSRLKAAFYGRRGFTALHPKIAVLGPLQGGTLPIMNYTTNALQALKQRSCELDMSGFASGFHLINDFIKEDIRCAVMQGNYVEMISQMLLEAVTEKPIDVLICMAQAPASGRVLNELRKRGIITVLWFVEDYQRFLYWKDIARNFDFVFTIQKGECLNAIRQAGAGDVHYLPTGCDPDVHRPMQLSQEESLRWGSAVSFVGAGYHNRQQTFAFLCDLPFKIWGTEWPTCRPFDKLVQEQGRRLKPEEYVKIFNASQININLHSSTERDGVDISGDFINPRTFELAACGAFQLVDNRTLLPEVFEPGRDLVTFTDVQDLRNKIEYYLAHPDERKEIAANGRKRALAQHTYYDRIKEMLSIIYSSKYEALRVRQEASPWARLLRRSKKFPEFGLRCQRAFDRGEEPKLDGLVADIVTGKGNLTETEQKLLFLHHIRSQISRMKKEESGKTES